MCQICSGVLEEPLQVRVGVSNTFMKWCLEEPLQVRVGVSNM